MDLLLDHSRVRGGARCGVLVPWRRCRVCQQRLMAGWLRPVVQAGASGCPAARGAHQGQHRRLHRQLPGGPARWRRQAAMRHAMLCNAMLPSPKLNVPPCLSVCMCVCLWWLLQHPEGGFGGGPYQLAHLAPTYAAVCTLVTLGGADALRGAFISDCHRCCSSHPQSEAMHSTPLHPLDSPAAAAAVVDRPRLLEFFLRMCVAPERGGGMTMHEGEGTGGAVRPAGAAAKRCTYCSVHCSAALAVLAHSARAPPHPHPTHVGDGGAGGEVDVRGCYCALAACEMLRLDKGALAAAGGLVDYIRRCQVCGGGGGGGGAHPRGAGMGWSRLLFTTSSPRSFTRCVWPSCLPPSTRTDAELRGRHRRRARQRGPRRLHLLRPGSSGAAGAGEIHSSRGQGGAASHLLIRIGIPDDPSLR